jgi:hypothetical protein
VLHNLSERLPPHHCEGAFSQIVALLPCWVADLLDQPE